MPRNRSEILEAAESRNYSARAAAALAAHRGVAPGYLEDTPWQREVLEVLAREWLHAWCDPNPESLLLDGDLLPNPSMLFNGEWLQQYAQSRRSLRPPLPSRRPSALAFARRSSEVAQALCTMSGPCVQRDARALCAFRYLSSLYWALTMVMKTAYVGPDTAAEKMLASCLVILGSLIYITVLAQVRAFAGDGQLRESCARAARELRWSRVAMRGRSHTTRAPHAWPPRAVMVDVRDGSRALAVAHFLRP